MISIIIPIYNAERFLTQCLDSVLAQTMRDWELLAVNDGSADRSLAILEDYATRDPRVHIINKQNAGVSAARNTGLAAAKGDYVYFADADDELLPTALELLVKTMEKEEATLVRADFEAIGGEGQKLFENKKQVLRRRHALQVMDGGAFARKVVMGEWFLWTCLFRRDIIEQHRLRFLEGVRLMEDAAFIADYLCSSPRCVYRCATVYRYRKYDGGATGTPRDYTADLQQIEAHVRAQSPQHAIARVLLPFVRKARRAQSASAAGRMWAKASTLWERLLLHAAYHRQLRRDR